MPEFGEPGEVHPRNPGAIRGAHGIWNEHILPIVLWEIPRQRKVLPISVVAVIGHPSTVIRVSIDVDKKERTKHPDTIHHYESFDLESWAWVHDTREQNGRRWEFVQIVDDGSAPWPLMTVIGEDHNGSLNLISLHRRNRRWMKRLIRGGLGFQKRLK